MHTYGVTGNTLDYTYTLVGSETVRGTDCWKIDGTADSEDSHGTNRINLTLWYEKSNCWNFMRENKIAYAHRGVATMILVRSKK